MGKTHGSILGLLGLAALECNAMTLVLQTLRSDQTLDTRSLGVWLLGLLALLGLGLDLTANDELANLYQPYCQQICYGLRLSAHLKWAGCTWLCDAHSMHFMEWVVQRAHGYSTMHLGRCMAGEEA